MGLRPDKWPLEYNYIYALDITVQKQNRAHILGLRPYCFKDMHSACTFNHRYLKSNPPGALFLSTFILTVRYSDEVEARNYSYSLEVGGNGRKLIWEDTPTSIRHTHSFESSYRYSKRK
ncbi:hypothetical protein GQ457_04G030680 [Hibiscus cannabinus]